MYYFYGNLSHVLKQGIAVKRSEGVCGNALVGSRGGCHVKALST
jgi:hypothetical protein